jgi:predicted DNA-binding antitoxin AbrB/MazE fold protein
MTITIQAVYESGVQRPIQRLDLAEGATVEVIIALPKLLGPAPRPPTPEEEDYVRRMKAAKSLEEMYAVMETAPPCPDYDILAMINESRRLTGFRMPLDPS